MLQLNCTVCTVLFHPRACSMPRAINTVQACILTPSASYSSNPTHPAQTQVFSTQWLPPVLQRETFILRQARGLMVRLGELLQDLRKPKLHTAIRQSSTPSLFPRLQALRMMKSLPPHTLVSYRLLQLLRVTPDSMPSPLLHIANPLSVPPTPRNNSKVTVIVDGQPYASPTSSSGMKRHPPVQEMRLMTQDK